LLVVTNSAIDSVSILDLASGEEAARAGARREPWFVRVTPDESLAVVGNRLPAGDASQPSISAVVSLIELPGGAEVTEVPLPANSLNVLGIAISSDGRWAYVLHNLGRTTMSTERISGGWINRNLLSVIDLRARRLALSTPLDSVTEGAANPWGAALSRKGDVLWVSISGTHELGRLDLTAIEAALRGASDSQAPAGEYGLASVYDLGVYTDGRFRRIALPVRSPRGLAVTPSGSRLAAAGYFSGDIVMLDASTERVTRAVPLGVQPEADAARRGEEVFHDATRCYQSWLSCATCHPEGRADGLNWDLFNDGVGNPKNTRSLLYSHTTPPAMARGVRPNMETAAEAGFRSILFQAPLPDDLRAVEAYLRSLRPEASPYGVAGALSPKARRGKELFERPDVGCATCHPPPLFTDLKMHDVGTRGALAWEDRFDTPTLVELWRTAPYLHHGRAKTLRDVFGEFNADDRHGSTSGLSGDELDALVEYLRSL
jgi:DNA-binding beta-propeller fold protein YncE